MWLLMIVASLLGCKGASIVSEFEYTSHASGELPSQHPRAVHLELRVTTTAINGSSRLILDILEARVFDANGEIPGAGAEFNRFPSFIVYLSSSGSVLNFLKHRQDSKHSEQLKRALASSMHTIFTAAQQPKTPLREDHPFGASEVEYFVVERPDGGWDVAKKHRPLETPAEFEYYHVEKGVIAPNRSLTYLRKFTRQLTSTSGDQRGSPRLLSRIEAVEEWRLRTEWEAPGHRQLVEDTHYVSAPLSGLVISYDGAPINHKARLSTTTSCDIAERAQRRHCTSHAHAHAHAHAHVALYPTPFWFEFGGAARPGRAKFVIFLAQDSALSQSLYYVRVQVHSTTIATTPPCGSCARWRPSASGPLSGSSRRCSMQRTAWRRRTRLQHWRLDRAPSAMSFFLACSLTSSLRSICRPRTVRGNASPSASSTITVTATVRDFTVKSGPAFVFT